MRRRYLVSLAAISMAASLIPAAPAPAPAPTDEAVRDRATFLPVGKYQPLPGTAVGVLAGDIAPVVALDGRSGPPDAMGFGRDGMSYRWVYVPVERDPLITNLTLPVGEKGDRKAVFPSLSMADPKTVKAAGVKAAYALVEVEVNGGEGTPAGEGFVATRIKVLDGSKAYPLDVATVVETVRTTHAGYAKGRAAAVADGLDAARRKALGDAKATGPRETADLMFVTWLAAPERLRVTFRTTVTDGAYRYGNGVAPLDPPALPVVPAGGRPAPPRPPDGVRFGTSFGVEYGRAYEVSKAGEVVRTETLPVEGFHKVLPPPPAADRRIPPPPRAGEQ